MKLSYSREAISDLIRLREFIASKNPEAAQKNCQINSEYSKCDFISKDEFNSYYKFSFVRNLWSRLVSEYRYRNYLSHRSFKDFVLNKFPQPGWGDQYRHVMSQTKMLYDKDGNCLVDFVGKFENLDADFK